MSSGLGGNLSSYARTNHRKPHSYSNGNQSTGTRAMVLSGMCGDSSLVRVLPPIILPQLGWTVQNRPIVRAAASITSMNFILPSIAVALGACRLPNPEEVDQLS